MSIIGVEIGKNECIGCPYKKGFLVKPDGKESISEDHALWNQIKYAYCFLASLFNISDAEEAKKLLRRPKYGTVPEDCPKSDAFTAFGIIER